uniref:Putative tight junction n=1 Tax=Lutzomyia longipalpis TaxID=7200 RepID=A0A1B0CKN4_LUTLO
MLIKMEFQAIECEEISSDSSNEGAIMKRSPAIGTYFPFNGGSPQLGYFVPFKLPPSVDFLTPGPQTLKRNKRDTLESHRSTSYCGSTSPTLASGSRRSSMTNSTQPIVAPVENSETSQDINTIEKVDEVETKGILRSLSLRDKKKLISPGARKKEKRHTVVALHQDGCATFSENQTARKRKEKHRLRPYHSMNETIEVLADPVVEDDPTGERSSWEYHTVTVTRVPGYGFGIAVSGGRDNPHFANGDPSIAVSDVLKGGPAEERLQVNDRIISVNGVSLENVEYATAVQVLRDSGNTVTLVVKRRVANLNLLGSPSNHQHSLSLSSTGLTGPNSSSQQTIKVSLSKNSKKEEFGITLGCRLFIKEISSKARDQLAANGYHLQEGDTVTRLHNTNCNDSMSLKEAKKIIDGCKERLNIVVLRDVANNAATSSGMQSPAYSHTAQISNCSNIDEAFLPGGASYSAQNLYVQPPTRPALAALADDKSNLTPRGRSRGPLMDVSLSQLDRPSTPPSHSRSRSGVEEPVRPPPPRADDFYSSRRQLYEDDPLQRAKPSGEPRFISFQKEGSVGIRLTGGNEAGIFVTAVQPGSPASLQGLTPGDKILKVNDMDMHGVTREEAVLFLLSLQDRIDLIVQHCREEYDTVVANQRGDSFHIKTHFHCDTPSKGEMSFRAGDVFRVIDTLHNGVVGSWQVLRIGRGHQEMQRGVIPNKSRAEELATAQFNASKKEMNAAESRGSFFKRRRSTHRRSKSLSRENWEDVVFSDSISKFPAYERVVLRHPGFVRPVCLFGPVADIARERMIKDFPDKFTAPLQNDSNKGGGSTKCGIVRLSNIRDIMDRGKHALLDITPNAVDRLNYAQFYPIVIFLKADSKHTIKQLRRGLPKSAHKSSKKLLEQCQKLEKVWAHAFSTTIPLNDAETWYRKLRDVIDQQQSGAVWMSESKPVESLSDDFLFPMTTSRLSYASSPESDLELSPGPSTSLSLGNLPHLVKSSSDPSIATNQDNLDRDREMNLGDGMPPPYTNHYDHASPTARRPTMESKYPYPSQNMAQTGLDNNLTYATASRLPPPVQGQIYGAAPDLPPRVDRASKPPGNVASPERTAKNSSIHSISTLSRSAQERLFATPKNDGDPGDEYATRNQLLNAVDKRLNGGSSQQASLERQTVPHGGKINNGSYDSVSSYDSYNTAQMAAQNIRLGPNAPDDLKSVPNANGRTPSTPGTEYQRNSAHEFSRSTVHELSRSLSSGANDLNRQSSPARGGFHGGDRNIPSGHDAMRGERGPIGGVSLPQRPTNLPLDGSPRKLPFETKTDYGKYSRNNSATQADYSKTTKTGPMGGQPPPPGVPFKPVPPPKPKNYRPPIQGGGSGGNQWENGDSMMHRSPNGYGFYPTPSHFHGQNPPTSPMNSGPPPINYGAQYPGSSGHFNTPQSPFGPREGMGSNGFGGNHLYNGQYMHRSPGFGNLPHQPPERNTLDLAGSREQRGSAFELYRKPQISTASHHHNLRELMDNAWHPPSTVDSFVNALNEQHLYQQQRVYMATNTPPPLPPPVKPKKKLLTTIKNAFLRTTRPLRRQVSSVADSEKKSSRSVRRQHSMMEPRMYQRPPMEWNPYSVGAYQELQYEALYERAKEYHPDPLYANRALIDFEQRMPPRGILRRHSFADRPASAIPFRRNRSLMMRKEAQENDDEGIYQSRGGSYMLEPNRGYPTRRDLHRDHLYQSKKEMQERIQQGRIEIERATSEPPSDSSSSAAGSHMGSRDLRGNNFRTRSQLRDHIYQSRREAMESMAEPIYVSRKEERCQMIPEGIDEQHGTHQTTVSFAHREEAEGGESLSNEDASHSTGGSTVVAAFDLNNDTVMAMSPRPAPRTSHLSSIIKRTASEAKNPPAQYTSRTSIETQYTSQVSLPSLPSTIGPPNASSTPYDSTGSLGVAGTKARQPQTTRGIFDTNGGTLVDPVWNVSLEIPKGAIPQGKQQEIYFTVTDPRMSECVGGPPLDMENGETMLSPLVMCGPQGLEFLVPVTLNIPHCAGRTASLGLALKATDSEKHLNTNWDNIDLPTTTAAHTVSVKVDHF